MHCSPSHYKNKENGTCFSKEELSLIAKDINLKSAKQVIKPASPVRETVKKIERHFYTQCKNKREYCWIDHLSPELRRKLESAFRPKKPASWYKNPRTWLNTNDIKYVMEQYEHLHTDFAFLGVHPIDFAEKVHDYCISGQLCDFDFKNYPGKDRFALVLNLDDRNGPGSHWVAVYFNKNPNLNNYGIYYYDSTASPPEDRVVEFMAKVTKAIRESNKLIQVPLEILENKVQRQFKNTECGMFCIVFLTQCVKNIPFREICQRMRKDDAINGFRDELFRPSK